MAWFPVFAWMGLMSYLSTDHFSGSWSEGLLGFWVTFLHLPVGAHGVQLANLVLRKSAHFFEFFVLSILLYRALSPERQAGEPVARRVLVQVLLLGFAWAVLDELHQAFTRTRGASFVDVGVDFAGIFAGVWITAGLAATLRSR